MISMILLYCVMGSDCQRELVAEFPQEDVGMQMCEISREAINSRTQANMKRKGIRDTATFQCVQLAEESQPVDDLVEQAQRIFRVLK